MELLNLRFTLKDLMKNDRDVVKNAYNSSRIEAKSIYIYELSRYNTPRTLRQIEKITFQSHIAEKFLIKHFNFVDDTRKFMDIIGSPGPAFPILNYDVYTGKDPYNKRDQLRRRRDDEGYLVADKVITLMYSEGEYRYESIIDV